MVDDEVVVCIVQPADVLEQWLEQVLEVLPDVILLAQLDEINDVVEVVEHHFVDDEVEVLAKKDVLEELALVMLHQLIIDENEVMV